MGALGDGAQKILVYVYLQSVGVKQTFKQLFVRAV
jgi:hypothetical protein